MPTLPVPTTGWGKQSSPPSWLLVPRHLHTATLQKGNGQGTYREENKVLPQPRYQPGRGRSPLPRCLQEGGLALPEWLPSLGTDRSSGALHLVSCPVAREPRTAAGCCCPHPQAWQQPRAFLFLSTVSYRERLSQLGLMTKNRGWWGSVTPGRTTKVPWKALSEKVSAFT